MARQVLRFEGPDGKGPCYGPHNGVFFSRYLAKMASAHIVPEFKSGKHLCAIDAVAFDWWCPPQALEEAEAEGLNLCVYTVEHAYDEDPAKLYSSWPNQPVDEQGRAREYQVVFDPEAVISKVQLKPTEFSHDVLKQQRAA
jgi:hypothetical protein